MILSLIEKYQNVSININNFGNLTRLIEDFVTFFILSNNKKGIIAHYIYIYIYIYIYRERERERER